MPIFTTQISNLRSVGPILDVQIAPNKALVTALLEAGESVPSPLTVSAMLDTGATSSVVKEGIVQELGLLPVGITGINTPSSHNVLCYQYFIRLVLQIPEQSAVFLDYETVFIEAPMPGHNIQVLLGRDFLSMCNLLYDGTGGRVILYL